MKTMSRTILAAVASVIAIVSCGKVTPTGGDTPGGDTPGGNTEPEATERIIAVSFDTKATRTTFDGTAYDEPHFVAGDLIRVWKSDGSGYEDFAVYERNSEYYIKVGAEFSGDLKAVYPSKYATTDSDNPFYVPSVQTGQYADANICMATIEESATSVVFYDQTAVIGVKVPGNTSHLEVTSLGLIGPDGYRGTTCIPIIDESGKDPYTITVDGGPETVIVDEEYMYFVSILTDDTSSSNVKLIDLNFDITYGSEGNESYSMGGFPPVKVWKLIHPNTTSGVLNDAHGVYTEKGSMYILPKNYLHDYVLVDGVKWATMNIGATSLTDPGDYFFWAGIDGHRPIMSTEGEVIDWTNFDTPTFDTYTYPESAFIVNNAPYYNIITYGFDCYNETNPVLVLWEDAAFAHWGGAWSMLPADSPAYSTLNNGIPTDVNNDGNKDGFLFGDVFLPYDGWGNVKSRDTNGKAVDLWSSSVWSDDSYYATAVRWQSKSEEELESSSPSNTKRSRSYGLPIRPVCVCATGGDDSEDLFEITIEDYGIVL